MIKHVFNNIVVLRHLKVRPRLTAAVFTSCIVFFFLLPEHWRNITKLLVAWDCGVMLYLLLSSIMMHQSDSAKIQRRAAQQDEGSIIILGLTVCSAIASLVAIMAELAANKGNESNTLQHVILSGSTVVLTWLFMQTMFALHYAHEYYNSRSRGNDGGLEFPGNHPSPDYWDFVYFSFVIGTAAQTADINITSKTIRRIVALHSVIVFFLNTTILALMVNVGASLL